MSALWTALEKLDALTFSALKKVEKMRGEESFFAREEKRVSHVIPPQKAITFDA